jgi:peptide/nickel transport system permease protein
VTAVGAPVLRQGALDENAKLRGAMFEALRSGRTRVGLLLCGLVVGVALVGPYLAPHSPTEFVGADFAPPSSTAPLGTDGVGRDVLSRFLSGGQNVLLLSVLATVITIVGGAAVALSAGYSLKVGDEVLMRGMDLLLAFPPIVLALMCISVVGSSDWLIVLVVGVSQLPQTARVVRAAVVQVRDLDFVKYAEAVGLPKRRILREQMLPNVTAPLMVEIGIRLTFAIGLIASLDYLGLGVQPPNPDWGLMIQENQAGLNVTYWPVLVPVLAIALLTIGTNLVTDGVARSVAGIDRKVDG